MEKRPFARKQTACFRFPGESQPKKKGGRKEGERKKGIVTCVGPQKEKKKKKKERKRGEGERVGDQPTRPLKWEKGKQRVQSSS